MGYFGRITADLGSRKMGETLFFIPAISGLPPELAAVLACLPIANVNGTLFGELARSPELAKEVDFACVLAVDPFYDGLRLADELMLAGVKGIANYPFLGFLREGVFDAMSDSGFNFTRELNCLATAKKRGMKVAAFVCTLSQGLAALDIGSDLVILAQGITQDEVARISDNELAEIVSVLRNHADDNHRILFYETRRHQKSCVRVGSYVDGMVYGP